MPRFGLLSLAIVASLAVSLSKPVVHLGSISSATPMLQARSGHSATLLPNGMVLVAGGMRRNQDFYRTAELYDPSTGKFAPTGEMTLARVGHAAVLLRSGKVLIVGGWIGHGATDSAELYDPSTGKFTVSNTHMAVRRGNPGATLLSDGDVLITGGADHDTPGGVNSAEVFHAAGGTFEAVSPMHVARISHTTTLLKDGRVLITGGRGERVNAEAELYEPRTRTFVATGAMLTARYKHTAGLMPDGRVLIAGGSDERDYRGNLNSAEIYDPKTGRFSATSSLNDARFKLPGTAVLLETGDLLIAGGSRRAEIYDPGSGKFVLVPGDIGDAWHFMTATPLKDGRVLMAGGYANDDRATGQTWIYRP